jgi:dihydroorotate dehydrogenase (fumarate)
MNLKANYMGLELDSPIIVGSSNLTTKIANLKKYQEAGAGAVVFKSLFEEQLHLENLQLSQTKDEYENRHMEMETIFPNLDHGGPKEYLASIKAAIKSVDIPVIASLNSVYDESWVDFAKQIEAAGAQALELNFYHLPTEFDTSPNDIINLQIDTVKNIKAELKIPIAVKLSPYYSNPLHLIQRLDDAGADAFVLFNKFFQPDINIETEELVIKHSLTSEGDYQLTLRFLGLLFNKINASLCGTRGVYNGEDMIKMMLAGADTVQVVSTVVKNGPSQINLMLNQLKSWMKAKDYKSFDDFKGKLSQEKVDDEFAYQRAQYIDILMNYKDIFKRYPFA